MINEIIITDLSDAEGYSFNSNTKYDVWITAVDDGDQRKVHRMTKNFEAKGTKHYAQFFADWSDEDGIKWEILKPLAPTKKHLENFINFLKPFVEDDKVHNLGVNCFAGISRSTALAIVALVMSGKTIDMALDYVLAIRPEAWPNTRMLGLASEILGKDIKSHIVQWKQNCLGVSDIFIMPDRKQKINLD